MHHHPPKTLQQRNVKVALIVAASCLALLFILFEAHMFHSSTQHYSTGDHSDSLLVHHHKNQQQQQQEATTDAPSSSSSSSSLADLLLERERLLRENAALKLKVQRGDAAAADSVKPPVTAEQQQQQQQQPWLIIGIPTVPRRKAAHEPREAVLLRTLDSLRKQLYKPTLFRGQQNQKNPLIKVVVVNNRPGSHLAFYEARSKWKSEPWVEFRENDSPYNDPPFPNATTTSPEFAGRHQEPPTEAVRRQTLDVATLLDFVAGRSRYFFLYEDDFHFCDNALLHVINMVERSNTYFGVDGWSAIRCSFGLAGIVMQNGGGGGGGRSSHNDVSVLRDYFLLHSRRRPPDHLAVEFYAKESNDAKAHFGHTRGVVAYRYNILRHDGAVSTLRDDEGWTMPGCFEELVEPQVFKVEAWSRRDCPDSDLWPCPWQHARLAKEDAARGFGFSDLGRGGTSLSIVA